MPKTAWPNPWMKLTMEAAEMAFEAQAVIGLRMLKLAAGGAAAEAEAGRMVSEKIIAATMAQAEMAGALLTGQAAHRGPGRALAHYRRKVKANRRRLSKPSR
jgi:hypothetical protein